MTELDATGRAHELRERLAYKPALAAWYREAYERYVACLERCPPAGLMVELGAAGGFAKELIPELIAADVMPYPGLDTVVDSTHLPFADQSLRALFMLDVFHHINDVELFLCEVSRCLQPRGRLFLVDQHKGLLSTPIYRYLLGEPFDPSASDWRFDASGPLSGANGALAWLVFVRDRGRFEKQFPELRLVQYRPHSPLRYWLAGGLRPWSLLPGWAYQPVTYLDETLAGLWPALGSFVDIEIERVA